MSTCRIACENIVCLCRLLYILTNFTELFIYIGKQCGPTGAVWSGLHCRRGFKNILAYDKASDMWVNVVSVQSALICKIGFTNWIKLN